MSEVPAKIDAQKIVLTKKEITKKNVIITAHYCTDGEKITSKTLTLSSNEIEFLEFPNDRVVESKKGKDTDTRLQRHSRIRIFGGEECRASHVHVDQTNCLADAR